MVQVIDMVGHKYGRITVLAYVGSWKNKRQFRCRCDCGKDLTIAGAELRSGHQTSCGCAKRERIIAINEARKRAKAMEYDHVYGEAQ